MSSSSSGISQTLNAVEQISTPKDTPQAHLIVFVFLAFAARDGHAVDFVGTVHDAHRAVLAPEACDGQIVAHAECAVKLDGAVEDSHNHVGGLDFDHRD